MIKIRHFMMKMIGCQKIDMVIDLLIHQASLHLISLLIPLSIPIVILLVILPLMTSMVVDPMTVHTIRLSIIGDLKLNTINKTLSWHDHITSICIKPNSTRPFYRGTRGSELPLLNLIYITHMLELYLSMLLLSGHPTLRQTYI